MRLEILDEQATVLGELVLRRRWSPSLGDDVYEVVLDGEFLMSSAVNDAEIALAQRALDACAGKGRALVGGLGLGHTAAAVLADPAVASLVVVELLAPVIAWHETATVPLGKSLLADPRCEIVHADFFELARVPPPDLGTFDAVIVDIDHSPRFLLHERHGAFYERGGPERLAALLRPHGVFALWSADPPAPAFLELLRRTFPDLWTEEVEFDVPQLDTTDTNTIVIGRRGA